MKKQYIVITMDIVDSRKSHAEFDKWFNDQILKINSDFDSYCNHGRRVFKSQGDECQLFVPLSEELAFIIFTLCYHMVPYHVRIGIGVGSYDGDIMQNSWDMNGPVFWVAKESLEALKLKKKSICEVGVVGSNEGQVISELMSYIFDGFNKWKVEVWEDIYNDITIGYAKHLAEARGVSLDGYYKRIQRSKYKRYLESINSIYHSLGGSE